MARFAGVWWRLRPGATETFTMGLLIVVVLGWIGRPLWLAVPAFALVQLLAMTAYAAYLTVTGRSVPGGGDDG